MQINSNKTDSIQNSYIKKNDAETNQKEKNSSNDIDKSISLAISSNNTNIDNKDLSAIKNKIEDISKQLDIDFEKDSSTSGSFIRCSPEGKECS